MADDSEDTISAHVAETAHEIAARIYTTWRNTHMNDVPVALFNRLEAASEHLIAEIQKHL